MKRKNKNQYVVHYCKNKSCNNAWIDKDITNAKNIPPQWKYCKECCEKLGIDFEDQTPKSNASEKQLEARKIGSKNLLNSPSYERT